MSEIVYALRFTFAARADIDEERVRLAAIVGEEAANSWRAGLLEAISTLATLPQRCIVAQEDVLFPEAVVRQFLYRRRRGSAAYRVLFTIHEYPDDAPFVRVQHVRHAAQAPLTEWPNTENGNSAG
jgi:plasmid stabilization system protein ParE